MKSSKLFAAVAVAGAMLVAPFANAATWLPEAVTINAGLGGFSVIDGSKTYTFTFTDSVSNAAKVAFSTDNLSQSSADLATYLKNDYSAMGFGSKAPTSVTGIGQIDNLGDSIKTFTASTTSSYNDLSIHFGAGTLMFHWTTPVDNVVFNITSRQGSFSNFRAFSATTPVPEPETYAMLIAGLGLVGFMARRRKQQ